MSPSVYFLSVPMALLNTDALLSGCVSPYSFRVAPTSMLPESSMLTTDGVSQSAHRDRCQWSVGGSLGIGYKIASEISLYAEPGVKHYFDNGSQVENFFKDQPTSFSMQLGVRVHF